MRVILLLLVACSISFSLRTNAQSTTTAAALPLLKHSGYQESKAGDMLYALVDSFGPRLTGSREYKRAADWVLRTLQGIGLDNPHFEPYCADCRGWTLKGFNLEMVSPGFMHLQAYPMAMVRGSNGTVEGELVHIPSIADSTVWQKNHAGKLRGKVVMVGRPPAVRSLGDSLLRRYSSQQLQEMNGLIAPKIKTESLPDMVEKWKDEDRYDQAFLKFLQQEGALGLLYTGNKYAGILPVMGTYYALTSDIVPLPIFAVTPEHFGRLARLLAKGTIPRLRFHLDVDQYHEPANNVNIIGEITGSDPRLKAEMVLAGGHFDSWHAGTGATDNASNSVTIIEAFRLLKQSGLKPKRTIRLGLWGGEEQSFHGSIAYAAAHYGNMKDKPNAASEKVSAYLNLDNGAGAIRGIFLQGNEMARPAFAELFRLFGSPETGALSIENSLSTDHETFNHYGIPSFQFIQDPLSYSAATHHTDLDLPEYVPQDDMKKNAVLLAWTLYYLAEMDTKVPRKPQAAAPAK